MNTIPFLIISLIKVVIMLFIILTACAYIVWLERKVVGRIQNRWGPTRVGPFGLLQPLADGIKFILKEDIMPDNVNKFWYVAAPMIALVFSLCSIAVIPFGECVHIGSYIIPLQVTGIWQNGHAQDINIGLLIILGLTSVGVYGIALSGWSSNSKYALLGSLRATAQMVSYELALGLSLVGVLMLSGSLSLREIVNHQQGWFWHWNVLGGGFQFVAFFIYLMAAYAETNRIPFDLPEAETELVAGYHTEYSAMKFAMFFVAEYANMVTVACLATILFFGGWNSPFGSLGMPSNPNLAAVWGVFWFFVKVLFFIFLYIWIRGTLPRFRYDQLMDFGWKFLLPLAIANIVITSLIMTIMG
ncbi:MAG: NADH-quinone oxidoreductase subunit NuoH [Acidobacteriaceae bacterium]